MTLKDLPVGMTAVIRAVGGEGALRQRFLDMGLIPHGAVTMVKYAPFGDPVEVCVHGCELALRLADAEKIEISGACAAGRKPNVRCGGLRIGGAGKRRATGTALFSEGTALTFALVGNQNCGKTALFNRLTGANQHVGNFPGVTVERKDGRICGGGGAMVTDLPGIYSLSAYSGEERVTRDFLLDERPKGILNIVDATNLVRNLYLTLQLMELDIPMVLALNMMDEVRKNGGSVQAEHLEELLGIPVIPISAAKNEGIEELIARAVHTAAYQEKPGLPEYPEGAACRCLREMERQIEGSSGRAKLPPRFAAARIAEDDVRIKEQLRLTPEERRTLERGLRQMERECGMDRAAALASMRFEFLEQVCSETVTRPGRSRERRRSIRLDTILTGKYTAVPCLAGMMGAVFFLTFRVIGAYFSGLLQRGMEICAVLTEQAFAVWEVRQVVRSLVIDGLFRGIGSVVQFLPVIVTLFFFLSILEDSGYMARVAFVMDRPMRKLGLSGRSIVPMLMGFGCTVPGVMASRTLPSERGRRMTILLTPFMSCSAKLPVYAFFTAAFFPKHSALVIAALYGMGILTGILVVRLLRGALLGEETVPFVMELPNYRMPAARNTGRLLWEKARDFLLRAFTVIFAATLVIWLLQNFDPHFHMTNDPENSILAGLAGAVAPMFRPMGFGDWRICTALLTGLMAKESVIATLSVLMEHTGGFLDGITPQSAASLLVFCLLYTPCVAAIAAVRRELGGRWAAGVALGQCGIAWIAAFAVYGMGTLLTA